MRKLSQFLTPQTLSYIWTLPRLFFVITNPISFLKSYLSGNLSIKELRFRNGLVYDIVNFDDLGVFYEIFIKREYGRTPKGKGKTIIDIGANNGLFMMYCKFRNRNATIHCCEPIPQCAEHIRNLIVTNNLENVFVHETAIAGESGDMKFFMGTQTVAASLYEDIASGHNAIIVKTVTLERIIHDNDIKTVDFLKVDCEGGEYDIFYGAPQSMLLHCKKVIIEYHDIDEKKNGIELYNHIKAMTDSRKKVSYHAHPAHPKNGFIIVK